MGRTPLEASPGKLPQQFSCCFPSLSPVWRCSLTQYGGKWPLTHYGGSWGLWLTSIGPWLLPPTIPWTGIPLLFLGGIHLCPIFLVQAALPSGPGFMENRESSKS